MEDRPLTGTDIYRVWVAIGVQGGTGCKPNDARRAFSTEALATVQATASHANGEATLRYVQAVDARKVRENRRLWYG